MILILMLLVFVSNAYAITYNGNYPIDVPRWLTGKFCIATGEEVLRADEDLEWIAGGQQVLCLNFDESNYTRTKVPDGSYLTQAPGCRPTLVYPDILWSPIERISISLYYGYVPTEPEAYFYVLQPYHTDSTDLEKYAGFQEGVLCNLPACFTLLGYVWDNPAFVGETAFELCYDIRLEGTAYYLKYAARDNDLVIQLVKATKDEVVIYHEFPYEYPWSQFRYAISEDEKIAWADPNDGKIYIFDGKEERQIEGGYGTASCMCWKDENNLIFLNDKGDETSLAPHPLIVYNIKDNTCSELTSLKGEPLRADDMLYGAEISQSGVLAFMSTFSDDGWNIDGQLTFLNTKNGEAYNIPLWDLIDELTCADEYDRSWYYDHMRFCWVE